MGTSSSISELDPVYQGAGLKIGIVMSRFNKDICEGLLSACEIELARLGVARDDVLLVDVPGALEHPLALQKMAQSGKFDALVAIGAVVRGEEVIMAHHDTRIEPGDHVIVFVSSKRLVPQVEELFQVSASFL